PFVLFGTAVLLSCPDESCPFVFFGAAVLLSGADEGCPLALFGGAAFASGAPTPPATAACPGDGAGSGGVLGTLGRRCARTSTARCEGVASVVTACDSAILVTTRTSSRRSRFAADLMPIFRNGPPSGSAPTVATVPTGRPLG